MCSRWSLMYFFPVNKLLWHELLLPLSAVHNRHLKTWQPAGTCTPWPGYGIKCVLHDLALGWVDVLVYLPLVYVYIFITQSLDQGELINIHYLLLGDPDWIPRKSCGLFFYQGETLFFPLLGFLILRFSFFSFLSSYTFLLSLYSPVLVWKKLFVRKSSTFKSL